MNQNSSYQVFRVIKIIEENYRTKTLIFDAPLLQAQPGQFVMVWLPQVGERPYSISGGDPFALTVVAVGAFSERVCQMQTGERLWVRGPLGQGYHLRGNRHLLAGGGYGSAPLYYLARLARAQNDQVQVCLGARTAQDILLAEKFEQIGCEVTIATDDGSLGMKGLVTQAVADSLAAYPADTLYGCGPLPMLNALVHVCQQHQLPHQLSWEALMRCGIGLCGSCELDETLCKEVGIPTGWLTCKDGPVYFHNAS